MGFLICGGVHSCVFVCVITIGLPTGDLLTMMKASVESATLFLDELITEEWCTNEQLVLLNDTEVLDTEVFLLLDGLLSQEQGDQSDPLFYL